MSIYYTVKEHLRVENTEKHTDVVTILHTRLSLLGAAMLRNAAHIEKAVIVADRSAFTFSGKTVTEAFHKAMEAIVCAQMLDAELCYGYAHNAWSTTIEPDSFRMRKYLSDKNPSELEGLFWSMYSDADCVGNGKGFLAAYGKNGNSFYHGRVIPRTVPTLPDGDWYAPMTAVLYDPEEKDTVGVDKHAVEEVCRQLCTFSRDGERMHVESGIRFALSKLVLKNDAELRVFAALIGRLLSLTKNTCGVTVDMVNLQGVDPQTASVTVPADSSYSLKLMTVA